MKFLFKKDSLVFFFLLSLSLLYLFYFFNKGINFYDEGYIVTGAQRLTHGEVAYKDFHFMYTPGTISLLSLSYKLLGESIITGRVLMIFVSLVGVIASFSLVKTVTKDTLVPLLSSLVYLVWGPAHINFPWPVMFVLPLLFIHLLMLLLGFEKKEIKYFLLSGLVSFFIFFFKQNFGLVIVTVSVVSLLIKKTTWQNFMGWFIGFIVPFLLFCLSLFHSMSFSAFINDFYYYSFQKIIVDQAISTPFPSQNILKLLFYLTPLFLFIVATYQCRISQNKKYVFIPVTLLFFYVFAIRPTSDYLHLIPILSISGISLAFLGTNNKLLLAGKLIFIALIMFGMYDGIFRNYYKWEAPISQQTNEVTFGKAQGLYLDNKNFQIISQLTPKIINKSINSPYIFTYSQDSLFYLLTDKLNPTKFNDLSLHSSFEDQHAVIDHLKNSQTKIIVTRFGIYDFPTQEISSFISKNYQQINSLFEFAIWEKR